MDRTDCIKQYLPPNPLKGEALRAISGERKVPLVFASANKGLLLILLLTFLFSKNSFAQDNSPTALPKSQQGEIHVYADPKLNEDIYLKQRLKNPEKETEFPGYRIQVFFGSDRTDANKIKAEFVEKYPDVDVYVVYESPNFKVRVGNFRNKIEAQKLLHDVKQKYDGAFIVPDKIKFPKL